MISNVVKGTKQEDPEWSNSDSESVNIALEEIKELKSREFDVVRQFREQIFHYED
jgi:hypothetical protein